MSIHGILNFKNIVLYFIVKMTFYKYVYNMFLFTLHLISIFLTNFKILAKLCCIHVNGLKTMAVVKLRINENYTVSE